MTCSVTVLVLLVCAAAVAAPTAAKRSAQCKGGCIIAAVVHPKRVCRCVVPQCSVPGAEQAIAAGKAALHAAAAAFQQGMQQHRRSAASRLAGLDCEFCDRDVNTYAR
eukprot:GHRQ01015408.1.p2 GENE.GHRQ01015408.1~~GHRQ01015408.1.p2  ORF type:complete len:108 (+),score=33.29 GHRQ01015408.1:598-921(+)